MPLDSALWVADVSEAAPAGPNLEFDAEFGALERAAQGKPDQQFGSVVVPAEEPEWKEVAALAAALTERTRDLRVLSLLAIGRLHSQGFEAFADVISVTRQLLESRWDAIHPQLDPEDDNDPTLRANALLGLGDNRRVLRFVREMPLASSARAGRFSWRDISVATGVLPPDEGKEKPTEAVISGAFRDTDGARIAGMRAALTLCVAELTALTGVFDANAGFGTGPDLTELVKLLREIQKFLARFAPAEEMAVEAVEDVAEPVPTVGAEQAAAPTAVAAAKPTGPITATALTSVAVRSDALHLLDLVIRYYERYEPSSPLPLLMKRAYRLAEKPFIEILKDLAPDGINQAQVVIGKLDETV